MNASIDFFPTKALDHALFSILIPSWNNLSYLKFCIESIRKNSRYPHQIIVHVNEGKDGTLEWVKSQQLPYTYSAENVGVCYGFNAPASIATQDYIVLSDDDFYYAPDWDLHLWNEVQKMNSIYFCLSSSLIEPIPSSFPSMMSPHRFGSTPAEFEEQRFLKEYHQIPFEDWNGNNWYPLLLHKHVWHLIGGLSTELSPGFGSDPDMMMKLWHCGIRIFKGVSQSRAYHFVSRTTSRVKGNNGHRQFLMKWGINISTFFKAYLRMGKKFLNPTPPPAMKGFMLKCWSDHMKKVFSAWGKNLPS